MRITPRSNTAAAVDLEARAGDERRLAGGREREGDQMRDVGVLRHVAGAELGVPAALDDLVSDALAALGVDVVDNDLRAFLREALRDAFSEPRAGPRHDGDLAAESHCFSTKLVISGSLDQACRARHGRSHGDTMS